MKYTYLLVDVLTIGLPLVFSFTRKFDFHRHWNRFFPAASAVASFFLLWDLGFTRIGIWGFNPRYVTGLRVGPLPVEEFLFFFCIPYACVFAYYCWGKLVHYRLPPWLVNIGTLTMIVGLFAVGLVNTDKLYSATTFISLGVLLVLCRYILRVNWLGQFYLVYLLLLFPLIIVDGILTGTGLTQPVVWYRPAAILGIRILTIPIEDIFYGLELLLLNLLLFHQLEPRLFRSELPDDMDKSGARGVEADGQ